MLLDPSFHCCVRSVKSNLFTKKTCLNYTLNVLSPHCFLVWSWIPSAKPSVPHVLIMKICEDHDIFRICCPCKFQRRIQDLAKEGGRGTEAIQPQNVFYKCATIFGQLKRGSTCPCAPWIQPWTVNQRQPYMWIRSTVNQRPPYMWIMFYREPKTAL